MRLTIQKTRFIQTVLLICSLYSVQTLVQAAPTQKDALYLHYDVAPDFDDIHAIVAGKQLADRQGVTPIAIVGTHSHLSTPNHLPYREPAAIAIADRMYGRGNYREIGYDHASHFAEVAAEWDAVISNGGTVYIAEGGPSDFTYGVLRAMNEDTSKVMVVQHSGWNERRTNDSSLDFVRSRTNYVKINDGNNENATADLNVNSSAANRKIMTDSSADWNLGFELYNDLVDFSDTVELLHIFDVPKSTVSNIASFANYVSGGAPSSQAVDTFPTAGNVIIIEAESFISKFDGTADKAWEIKSINGETGVQLLPDTRTTESDNLIAGVNFWNFPNNTTPFTQYRVNVEVAGEYLVEMRAYSTGSEDNGTHFGVNGNWLIDRLQWCTGKNQWTYTSAIRLNNNHCGVQGSAKVTLTAGQNEFMLGAREDGVFIDKIRLTKNGSIGDSRSSNNTDNSDNSVDSADIVTNETTEEEAPSTPIDFVVNISTPVSAETCEVFGSERNVPGKFIEQCGDQAMQCFNVGEKRWTCTTQDNALVDTVAAINVVGSDNRSDAHCSVSGNSLNEANLNYTQSCSRPRVDCDKVAGLWICASYSNPTGVTETGEHTTVEQTPDTSSSVSNITPVAIQEAVTPTLALATTTLPTVDNRSDAQCSVSGSSLNEAKTKYAQSCSRPRIDCDNVAGAWFCASYNNPRGVTQ